MTHSNFVHLHVHSAYSLSQGAILLKEVVKLASQYKQPAVAVTDTGNLFGALEFSQAAKKSGVQPIVGCQLNLRIEGFGESSTPIVALAMNQAGVTSLFKLSTLAFEQGDPVDPFISLEDLYKYTEGLFILTGGTKSAVNQYIVRGEEGKTKELLIELSKRFPNRLGVELVRHGLDDEPLVEAHLISFADELNLPLVASNDCYFSYARMHAAQDALTCIGEKRVLIDQTRSHTPQQAWFKTSEEMRELFKDLPEACDNTVQIAKRCSIAVAPHKPVLPKSPKARDGQSEADTLREMSREGLRLRLEQDSTVPESEYQTYYDRLEFELDVIIKMEFPGYFLIVADFIQWAKEHNIPVGPGRGSGAGSLVAYALTITNLNPIRFGLLFERFLNPERVSMPDFDIDFCRHRREEVVKYVQHEYGRERVSQIITFGQLKAKASIRAVGRVLGMPFGAVSRVAELIPDKPGAPDVPIGQLVKQEPKLQELCKDEMVQKLIDLSKDIQGLYSHASTHAAGLVIGDRPLVDMIPLYRDPKSEMLATQYSMKYAEQAGLVKFDFLGLATLTIIQKACEFIEGLGEKVDIEQISLSDAKTYEMMAKGDTAGVFQFESAGMRDTLKKMQVNRFEDLIAAVSLFRPGPMANIPDYCRRKLGEEWEPPHPMIKPILDETFGIMVYQEQVMQIAQTMAGYSLGNADMLRRAMGKKIASEMEEQRSFFVEGAVKNGVSEKEATSVFELMAKFAEYGFNKSHAAAYALVAYQTAWLKAHHPECLLAGSMSVERENSEKIASLFQEVKRLNIPLLPVDINKSEADFTVERLEDGRLGVRFGLAAIKKVGLSAMQSLVELRGDKPFATVTDLAERCNNGCLNKMSLENLVYAGALDCFEVPREDLIASLATIVARAAESGRKENSGQGGLFGDDMVEDELRIKKGAKWTNFERLEHEAKAIGFYMSAHPLDMYARVLKKMDITPLIKLEKIAEDLTDTTTLNLAGCFLSKREIITKRGSKMAWVNISDPLAGCEVTLFQETLASADEFLKPGQALWLRVTLKKQDENIRLTVEDIKPLEEVAASEAGRIRIHLHGEQMINSLKEILDAQPEGNGQVSLYPPEVSAGEEICINLPRKYPVTPRLVEELKRLDSVTIEME